LYQKTNSVALVADGVDDAVVVGAQLRDGDIPAQRDIAQEAHRGILGGALEGLLDLLDALVIGGHAGAHQPIGTGQPIEEIDADRDVLLLEEGGGGVEAGGAGSDDRDVEWVSRHLWIPGVCWGGFYRLAHGAVRENPEPDTGIGCG
jgi:hypothetical protein